MESGSNLENQQYVENYVIFRSRNQSNVVQVDWNKEINVMETLNRPELIYLSLRVTKYPGHLDNKDIRIFG